MVAAETTAEAGSTDHLLYDLRDLLQQAVALPDAEDVVKQLEILNIRADNAVVLLGVLQEPFPNLLAEELLAVDPGAGHTGTD